MKLNNRIAREPYFLVRVFSPFLKELFILLFVNLLWMELGLAESSLYLFLLVS